MKYLIVQEWENTKGNHAGMSHMCDMLVEKYPDEYIKITKSCPRKRRFFSNKIMQAVYNKWNNLLYFLDYMRICSKMFRRLNTSDKVFLLEYNIPWVRQYELAKYIYNRFRGIQIYALSHLSPTFLSKLPNIGIQVKKWDIPITVELTLGTTLTDYLTSLGIDGNKISTGFHYVDNCYYCRKEVNDNIPITIIVMGFLERQFSLIAEVVNRCPEINWIVCKGNNSHLDNLFTKRENLQLYGFLDESDLREKMFMADVSLNVMDDTVGSNVITTSMAMGLIILASDVGSIHDYCDNENAIFCNNSVDSFVAGIDKIVKMDPHDRIKMKKSSIEKASKLSINNIHKWFSSL